MKADRKNILYGVLAVILCCVAIIYSASYHITADDSPVIVNGSAVEVEFIEVDEEIASGHGFIKQGAVVTNAESVTHDGMNYLAGSTDRYTCFISNNKSSQSIQFKPGPYITIHNDLLSRIIYNIWGSTVLNWSCALEGAISEDGKEYCFYVNATGGGDAGYTILFNGDFDRHARIYTLKVTEKLWNETPRKFHVKYRIDTDGKMIYLSNHE